MEGTLRVFLAGLNSASFRNEAGSYLGLERYDALPREEVGIMKCFAAATMRGKDCERLEKVVSKGLRNRLLSYVDAKVVPGAFRFWLSQDMPEKHLFLDSGAFSAFTRGIEIDLKEYIEFIKENRKRLFCYAALDVIGDTVTTRRNYETMKAPGIDPIPTVHLKFPFPVKELEYYCEQTNYIALGGMVLFKRNRDLLKTFLDSSWAIIKKYWPIKVHAFGVSSARILTCYPFYSCDSTSAILGAGLGRVLTFTGSGIQMTPWQKKGKEGKNINLIDNLNNDGSHHLERRIHNIKEMVKYERFLTDLWAKRGIVWSD